jgi:Uma2 family endonuclease
MIATLRPLTYDDLLQMPDDGQRYEVINGELIVTPAPTADHQRVFLRLVRLLDEYAREPGRGELFPAPFDVVLGHNDVVEPDLVYLSSTRDRVPGDQNKIDYAPDLVVEIISPTSRRIDRVRKMALYARAGVTEFWIADSAAKTLVIHVLAGVEYVPIEPDADGRLTSRALPELRVDPREVFAGLD